MRQVQGLVEDFQATTAYAQTDAQLRFLLDSITPCLSGFFEACEQTQLHTLFDEGCMAMVQDVTHGLIEVATKSTWSRYLTKQQVENVEVWVRLGWGGVGWVGGWVAFPY